MIAGRSPGGPLGVPPYRALRARLAGPLGELGARPESLERELESWWSEQRAWEERLVELLRLHHDINNALVGVSGNIQLMLRDPAFAREGVRERLDVVMREAGRIQAAAARLRELKGALTEGADDARAA